MKHTFYIILAIVFLCTHQCIAQDSIIVKTEPSIAIIDSAVETNTNKTQLHVFKPSPQKAMLLTAILPGAGQIYNRKYWKAPIVWGGFAALAYAISWNSKYYNEYRKAYISIADNDESTNYYTKYIPEGQEFDSSYESWLKSALLSKKQYYRRYRDLSIMGAIGFYGLTILDAYVDAQLYDFDISPNLSLRIEPTFNNSLTSLDSSIGLRCQLTF